MSVTTDTTTANCPCDFVAPWQVITNSAGLSTLQYRVGDFLTFRHQLLLPLPSEQELINWRPSAKGDLALQMVEWWAYLADILTFYNERIANQSYLRTADQEESVKRLIRILGYRPCPSIGAFGTVAALMSNPSPSFTLPQGFPIQSKPGPGKQPQIFEVSAATSVSYPDVVNVNLVPTPATSAQSVLLKGAITSINANDELLLVEDQWNGSDQNYAVVTVQSTQQVKDPRGNINTQVTFTSQSDLSHIPPDPASPDNPYHLMKSTQSAHVWQYAAAGVAFTDSSTQAISNSVLMLSAANEAISQSDFVPTTDVHLDSIARQIKVGDPILFEDLSGANAPQLVDVTSYFEIIWYANPKNNTNPGVPPDPSTTNPPIPIPHTHLSFQPALTSTTTWAESTTLVRYAWQDVGQLIQVPSTTLSGTSAAVTAVPPATFPTPTNGPSLTVMVEDVNGNGAQATGTIDTATGQLDLSGLDISSSPLTAPLRVLFDLLPVTRGKTVPQEIIGSGDATIAGQEFVLQNSPLTYLLSSNSTSGGNYTSTLKIMVNTIEWKEVPSFYNQPSNAQVFVTREDENNITHVQFGDGINGARLPTSTNNVIATYRYGSGADSPDAGQLSVLTQAWPNLKAIRNPVAVGGGANPDPAKKIRQYAPQSVLTFGRAVSADDYETIAAQAPGVARARAYFTWNADQQRSLVTIYVGDNVSAVTAARTALNTSADPNRPVAVLAATPLPMTLHLSLQIKSLYNPDAVKAAVTTALLDDDTGLFGINAIRIGQVIYQSQIFAACMGVPGVQAASIINFSQYGIHPLKINLLARFIIFKPVSHGFTCQENIRYSPSEAGFFQLSNDHLIIDTEGS